LETFQEIASGLRVRFAEITSMLASKQVLIGREVGHWDGSQRG
jgi:hypothetical protein